MKNLKINKGIVETTYIKVLDEKKKVLVEITGEQFDKKNIDEFQFEYFGRKVKIGVYVGKKKHNKKKK
jgi:hypothetical protein